MSETDRNQSSGAESGDKIEPAEKIEQAAKLEQAEKVVKPEGKLTKPEGKMTKKEFVIKEARSILLMIIYLAISLSLVATFRCLVLIQHGINDFVHSYIVAVALAVALGKIVVLGQKLPVLNAVNEKPLIISVVYKAAFMAVLANLGASAEEHLFPHLHASTSTTEHPMLLHVTRELAMFWIFFVLFTWRDLDRVLGRGTLLRLFFRSRALVPAVPPPGD